MKKRQRIFNASLLLVSLLWASLSLGADLGDAKRSGSVGERADGYLGLVKPGAPTDVEALVKEINNKRRARYQGIAAENDLTLDQVQALAGKKTIEKTPSGGWILTNGGWRQK